MHVEFKNDNDKITADLIKKTNLPLIVYGKGSIAVHAAKKLAALNLKVSDYVLDDEYVDDKTDAISISHCNIKYDKAILLLGFFEAFFIERENAFKKFPCAKLIVYLSEIFGYEIISYDFYQNNIEEFNELFSILGDKTSKISYEAFLNAKINSDASYIWPYVVLPQYIPQRSVITGKSEKDFLNLRKREILVNCGAYNGDTIKEFLEIVGSNCEKIYALEPDKKNLEDLHTYVESNQLNELVQIYEVGASEENKTLIFSGIGTMQSRISDEGETVIAVAKIDDIVVGSSVTFINMDIEGAELSALKGAKETIKKYKPTLAISTYHKREDCIEIPKYLKALVPEYKFHFRLHKPVAIDAVLYATIR
jgi:FkbM family methyltransferase